MDLLAWIGFGLIVLYLAGGYLRIRTDRRSGATQSFGHSVLDNVLLFISGLFTAGTLGFALWFLNLIHIVSKRAFHLHALADVGRSSDVVLQRDSPQHQEIRLVLRTRYQVKIELPEAASFHSSFLRSYKLILCPVLNL